MCHTMHPLQLVFVKAESDGKNLLEENDSPPEENKLSRPSWLQWSKGKVSCLGLYPVCPYQYGQM